FQYTTSYAGLISLNFVPTSEGYFDFEKNKYIYNYSDHLGNVRLSYFQNGSSIEVLEENNYYPFGLKHEGYNGLAGNPSYNYKYNGKELQETGMYDYGARFYMPDIGRWGVVDPLAEMMRRHSPYNYAFNNPIRFIDPDGRAPLTDYYNLKGQLTKHIEDGKTDKKIVLTTSKKEADTDAAISNGHVVNQITNDQIKQIDDIYAFGKTDKTGTEKGFYFGQNGKSSKTVTGEKTGEVGPKAWAEAKKDLRDKGDTVASDAHLHPLDYDSEGNVVAYGKPTPSMGAGKDTDPKNMQGNQPSMVLGWTEIPGSLPPGQIGGTPSPNTYSPTVGFYNSGGSIITIDYSAFKKAMEKVNK
ncbi:RHS repeat domain-containing protein, partial [Chryseobacterium sp. 8AT]|uniref:RHS repeat domain-containing protein n=2 Tax=Chryseobacterium TaxID=59732 RepID=UPI00162759E0